ncbi:MAG: OmpA family protein [Micavibrio aeruginosavorus]|uniref:OmpA family protein n=1 Tax=Micavibrio aeruginosavorus TaxID=349221 RepID=A0A7T5R1L3_9BACT|nr:MAG: OmpA family protein [Micavibrio aeruginosavorus]
MNPSDKNRKKHSMGEIHTAQEAVDNINQPVETQMSRRRLGDTPQPNYVWLVTFTDIMGLMLTFFVMLFAMTEPEPEEWADVSVALQSQIGKVYGMQYAQGTEENIDLSKINFQRALDVRYLEELMRTIIEENPTLGNVALINQPGAVVVSLPQELLFDPGQAVVKDQGRKALYTLGGALARMQNRIEIAGHADPRPIEGGSSAFDNNWELSLARAAQVSSILENVGYEQDIAVSGYSSGRYQDMAAIKDETQRQDLARRVDIVIMNYAGRSQKISISPSIKPGAP